MGVRPSTKRSTPRGYPRGDRRHQPVIRGWGQYFHTGNAAKRFNRLDSCVGLPIEFGYKGRVNLPTQSFLALAAIGWADGSLQRIEAVGLLHAAKEAGLSVEDFAEVEAATKKATTIDELDLAGMSQWDQVFTYALAAWFAQLDGVVSTSEHTVMVTLGEKLGLPEPLRKRAQVAAYDIACLPESGRPERYDFQKLAARIAERMPQVSR